MSTLTATAVTDLPARAAVANAVYVFDNNFECSDTAPDAGSEATPYCTLPAALASSSVVSGTTIMITGNVSGAIDITKSDITIEGRGTRVVGGAYGISLVGRHHVTLNGVGYQYQTGEALRIDSSTDITVNSFGAARSQDGSTTPDPAMPAISVTGSTRVTLSDGVLQANPGPGVLVQQSSQVVVSDTIVNGSTGGIALADSTGVDVVSDTIDENCGAGISVLGASTDVDIADNIVSNALACGATLGTALTVDTTAAPPTVDANILTTAAGTDAVSWQGRTFADGPALDAAGDGAHDLTVDPGFAIQVPAGSAHRSGWDLAPGSPAIDSADSGAPNMPARDRDGAVRTDDLAVADTGTGPIAYADRGAVELARQATPTLTVTATAGRTPSDYRTVSVAVQGDGGSWWPIVSYNVDFGDGTKSGTRPYPEAGTAPSHTYGADKTYNGTVTVTDAHGRVFTTPFTVTLAKRVFSPSLEVDQSGPSLGDVTALIQTTNEDDPYLGSYAIDFGDHTPTVTWTSGGVLVPTDTLRHTYAASGTYTVTLSATDNLGWPTAQPVVQKFTVTLPVPYQPPTPIPTTVHRIGGTDRYATARLVSQAQWKAGTASAVVLARGDQAPDALSGVPLAAHVHGPLLLTSPGSLDAATRAEIDRVTGGPSTSKTVYILGGASAIAPGIEDSLRKAGYQVVRYEGTDRYRTSLAVAGAFGSTAHVIVATGLDFPDALAAGPLGAVENAPIILSKGDALDPAVTPFVRSHQDIDPVGGAAQRAVAKISTTGRTVSHSLAGATRYDTAAAVANAVMRIAGHTTFAIGVASGKAFPDALTGGAYAANAGMPLLITDPAVLSSAVRGVLIEEYSTLRSVTLFGGNQAVSDGVEATIANEISAKIQ
ncbi:putative cell wall binding repeat 2-containing protein [Catenulispora acidiphila DSM 44928]|uniref:Putative cell wall binding repeat 2-containing protein n=2 Tax=Catenulispora TaxID=414878 RepID=C7Q4Q1_CATAD|nr:putative cell wall binding repeat 2-containing protein [Catenulispora acidiphila DSM 44928]